MNPLVRVSADGKPRRFIKKVFSAAPDVMNFGGARAVDEDVSGVIHHPSVVELGHLFR